MLIYLDHAWEERKAKRRAEGQVPGLADLYEAIMEGAVERVRPKMMTVVAIMAGLLPIMWGLSLIHICVRPFRTDPPRHRHVETDAD